MSTEKFNTAEWVKRTQSFQKPNAWTSWWQVLSSFVPFIALWVLAYQALQVHWVLMVPLSFVAGMFAVRIFIIQHDCGHASFFKQKWLRDWVGRLCSLVTITPYRHWQWTHAQHHAHNGDLSFRDIGEVETLTAREFLQASPFERFSYRLYRSQWFMFIVAPFLLFFVANRVPHKKALNNLQLCGSIILTNLTLLVFIYGMAQWLGWVDFLLVYTLTVYFAAMMGVLLFYVQHQFEDGYWQPSDNWNYAQAAMHGSSYFKLPKVLQWFTGSIGFHHVHHLSPLVPNYELEKCHDSHPAFAKEVTTLTLANCWQTMKLRFWDEHLERLITLREMRDFYAPRKRVHNLLRRLQPALQPVMQ